MNKRRANAVALLVMISLAGIAPQAVAQILPPLPIPPLPIPPLPIPPLPIPPPPPPSPPPPSPPPDTTPPSVTITSPEDGSTVSGTISVTAGASDNRGVVGVQFRLDGDDLGTEDTTAPYARSWDTTTAANGTTHTLTAIARDAAGNTSTASVSVTVSNEAPPSPPPPPPGTTPSHFEESAASFTGTGWVTRGPEIAAFSGDTARSSNVAGDTASFVFTGTGVSWIGLRCSICGKAKVSIDGVEVASEIDTAGAAAPGSPGLASEVVFTASSLAPGSHTMVITVTGTTSSGGAHVVVDAFDVTGAGGGPPPTRTRSEQTDPAISYSGTWLSGTDARVSGSTYMESNEAGARAVLSFTGTAVSWISARAPWAGIARVSVDRPPISPGDEVDNYAPSEQAQVEVFRAGPFPRGPHTLTIEVTGTHNSAATSGFWVIVDAFDVTP
jgi:hypothetical protein